MQSTKQLILTPSGDYQIKKDNNFFNCPFQPAIPTQNSLGSIEINRIPCSSNCPHFNIVEDIIEGSIERITTVIISCSGIAIEHEMETIIDNAKTNIITR